MKIETVASMNDLLMANISASEFYNEKKEERSEWKYWEERNIDRKRTVKKSEVWKRKIKTVAVKMNE